MNIKEKILGVIMGQKDESSKINLPQLVLLGLGSLIGSGWLLAHGRHLPLQDQPQLFLGLSVL